jgi:hypothetical protein
MSRRVNRPARENAARGPINAPRRDSVKGATASGIVFCSCGASEGKWTRWPSPWRYCRSIRSDTARTATQQPKSSGLGMRNWPSFLQRPERFDASLHLHFSIPTLRCNNWKPQSASRACPGLRSAASRGAGRREPSRVRHRPSDPLATASRRPCLRDDDAVRQARDRDPRRQRRKVVRDEEGVTPFR